MAQLDNVWRHQRLSFSKDIHLSCAVGSVIWFWNVDNAQSRQWQFHMQALRRILGIRWYDKVSNAVVNERTKLKRLLLLTSFIIWSHLSPTGEHTCFAGTPTVNRSPRCWLEGSTGLSTKNMAATSGRRHWPVCWRWSSAAVSNYTVFQKGVPINLWGNLVKSLPIFKHFSPLERERNFQ